MWCISVWNKMGCHFKRNVIRLFRLIGSLKGVCIWNIRRNNWTINTDTRIRTSKMHFSFHYKNTFIVKCWCVGVRFTCVQANFSMLWESLHILNVHGLKMNNTESNYWLCLQAFCQQFYRWLFCYSVQWLNAFLVTWDYKLQYRGQPLG